MQEVVVAVSAAVRSGRESRRWRQSFVAMVALAAVAALLPGAASAAGPCDAATHPGQCGWFDPGALPPFVSDAILSKGGVVGAGNVLVLTSGDPGDPDGEISNDVAALGCGTNPDGWETYDCVLLDAFVPPQDSVVLALSSEWFEWYQSIFTDWMTISSAGVPTVDVSINSWINSKVDIIPYGPSDTGVVILTSLAASKMVNFRVADSGDHIYDTAIVVVPATWFASVEAGNGDDTILCGDGVLEPGEECDDGNTITDDGCSSLCLGTQPPSPPPAPATCGNLVYSWPNGTTSPYTCGNDTCAGYRCVAGNTISPACFTAEQCAIGCAGECVDIPTASLDCSTLCSVQPPATEPPPVPPATCDDLFYSFPDGTSTPYACDDTCIGQRCVTGTTISPTCYAPGACDATTCPDGTCVDTPTDDCTGLCDLGVVPAACSAAEIDQTRPAANQKGPCLGNVEICKSSGFWELADGSWQPDDELCNGIDDDCNGVSDDMFVTCGDPGLCQNTVNTCDPANPTMPVACVTLPPPSPVEICNDGLDNDCEGSPDDGCECGDDECMPGETYEGCPADCPPPPNGTPCDDGDLCTAGDAYQSGACIPGAPVTCESDNACVVGGTCNPATGCSATKVNCDDGDPCTIDSCDPVGGCAHAPDPVCTGDADGDGYPSVAAGGTDCDDTNPAVHPGAAELCNGIDDDCDTVIDPDGDADGTCDADDGCPADPAKIAPGVCGCGVSDQDGDGDGVADCQDQGQDLAVTVIAPPSTVTLTAKKPVLVKNVTVKVQNRGPATEVIPDATALGNMLQLTVSSLGIACPDPLVTLAPPSAKSFPIKLKSKATRAFHFDVTFDCANDPAKTTKKDPGHDDFRYVATVNRSVLDARPDTHAVDDTCPRSVTPPYVVDPNPDGKIKDKGCGDKKDDGTFGLDETTDVIVNP